MVWTRPRPLLLPRPPCSHLLCLPIRRRHWKDQSRTRPTRPSTPRAMVEHTNAFGDCVKLEDTLELGPLSA